MTADISVPKLPKRGRKDKNFVIKTFVQPVRNLLIGVRMFWLRKILGMDLHPTCKLSLKASLDFTNPRGVHIGEGTYVAFGATSLAHDMCRVTHFDTYIGKNCFIGARSIILPGVMVGDECIIGAGSVVAKDVPAHSLVIGNPGKIVKSDVRTRKWGILVDSYEAYQSLPEA